MIYNAGRRGMDDVSKLTRSYSLITHFSRSQKRIFNRGRMTPVLFKLNRHQVSITIHWKNDSVYIPAVDLDDDLAVPMVVDFLEFTNRACLDGISIVLLRRTVSRAS